MIDLGNWLGEVYRFSRPIDSGDVQDDPALISHLMASTREH
jgi:hypothetical protein